MNRNLNSTKVYFIIEIILPRLKSILLPKINQQGILHEHVQLHYEQAKERANIYIIMTNQIVYIYFIATLKG